MTAGYDDRRRRGRGALPRAWASRRLAGEEHARTVAGRPWPAARQSLSPATASPPPPSRRTRRRDSAAMFSNHARNAATVSGSTDPVRRRPRTRHSVDRSRSAARRSPSTKPRSIAAAAAACVRLAGEQEEVDDVPRLREVGAAPGELPERQAVRLLRRRSAAPWLRMRSRKRIVSRVERLLEVVPERVRILEADGESKQAGRDARRPPSAPCASIREVTPPRLVVFAISAVDGLDARVRRRRRRRRTRGGRRSPGSGRSARRDGRAGARARSPRGLALARDAHLERLEPAQERARPCRPRERGRCAMRNSSSRAASSRRLHTTAPTSASSCPARYFVAEWTARSQPSSSGRTWSGVAAVESHTTRAGCAAAASKSGIVRNGFDGASSQTRSTPRAARPVWSNSTLSTPQRASSSSMTPVP